MRHLTLLVCCMIALPCAATEIYTWTDADGLTHYSDKPPADAEVNTIDLEAQALTVIGDAGLRPGEEALLRRFEEAAAREETLRRQQAASQPSVTIVQAEDDDGDDGVVYYFLPRHGHFSKHHFKHQSKHGVNISVHGDFEADKSGFQFHAEHGARPPRQTRPHHHINPQRYANSKLKTPAAARASIGARPGLARFSPAAGAHSTRIVTTGEPPGR